MALIKDHINDGTICGLEAELIPYIKNVLTEFQPQIIIEMGIYHGGFTKYLSTWFPKVPIYAIDLVYLISKRDMKFFRKQGNVTFYITQQLFRDEPALPIILSLPLRKFLFCDNGRKDDEVRTYAGYLRPGDLLGIHDYGSEVKPEVVRDVLAEFHPHSVNRYLSDEHIEARLFAKKNRDGRNRAPNDFVQDDYKCPKCGKLNIVDQRDGYIKLMFCSGCRAKVDKTKIVYGDM